MFIKIFLGHDKVIHYRDGFPVRSVTSPAVYSKPMANLTARTFMGKHSEPHPAQHADLRCKRCVQCFM